MIRLRDEVGTADNIRNNNSRYRNRIIVWVILFVCIYTLFYDIDDRGSSSSSSNGDVYIPSEGTTSGSATSSSTSTQIHPNLRGISSSSSSSSSSVSDDEAKEVVANNTAGGTDEADRGVVYIAEEDREGISLIMRNAIRDMDVDLFVDTAPKNITGVYSGRWTRGGPSFVDWTAASLPLVVSKSAAADGAMLTNASSNARDGTERAIDSGSTKSTTEAVQTIEQPRIGIFAEFDVEDMRESGDTVPNDSGQQEREGEDSGRRASFCDVFQDIERVRGNNRAELHIFAEETSVDHIVAVRSEFVLFSTHHDNGVDGDKERKYDDNDDDYTNSEQVVETPTVPDNLKRYTPTHRIAMRGVYVRPYNEVHLFSKASRVRVTTTTMPSAYEVDPLAVSRPPRGDNRRALLPPRQKSAIVVKLERVRSATGKGESGGMMSSQDEHTHAASSLDDTNEDALFSSRDVSSACLFQLRLKLDSVANAIATTPRAGKKVKSSTSHYIETSGSLDSPHFNATIDVSLSGFEYDRETFHFRVKLYALLVTVCGFAQALAMIHQMHVSGTQAGAARISVACVSALAIFDAYVSLAHVLAGIVYERVFQLFVSVGFLQFVLFAVFDMRFALIVWKAIRRDAFNSGGWNGVRHELSLLYSRFYSILVLGVVIFGEILKLAANDAERLARLLHDMFVFVLYSFWIPQIAKNFRDDSARAFTKYYVVTMTLSRLVVPIYFTVLSSSNFLTYASAGFANAAMSSSRAIVFVSYVIGQMVVLLLQQEFGAKFFVPSHLRPPRYDYFRDVPVALRSRHQAMMMEGTTSMVATTGTASTMGSKEETTMISELRRRGVAGKKSDGDEDEEDGTVTVAQCVICMSPIETIRGNPRARRAFMLTPCDHVFHSECLHPWLRVKSECPTCRRRLPPP